MTLQQRIRIEMIKKDITGAEIARSAGVDRTAVYKCMDGLIKSRRLRKAIADALGVSVEALWPSSAKAMAGKPEDKMDSRLRGNDKHQRKAA